MADQELSGVRGISEGLCTGSRARLKNIENGKYYFTNVFCSFDSMVVGFNGSS